MHLSDTFNQGNLQRILISLGIERKIYRNALHDFLDFNFQDFYDISSSVNHILIILWFFQAMAESCTNCQLNQEGFAITYSFNTCIQMQQKQVLPSFPGFPLTVEALQPRSMSLYLF